MNKGKSDSGIKKDGDLIGSCKVTISIADVLKADEEGRLRLPLESLEKDLVLTELQRIRADQRLSRCKRVHEALDRLEMSVNERKKFVGVHALQDEIQKVLSDTKIFNGKYALQVLRYLEEWVDAESKR